MPSAGRHACHWWSKTGGAPRTGRLQWWLLGCGIIMNTTLQVHLFAFSGLLLEQSGCQLDGCCRGTQQQQQRPRVRWVRCGLVWIAEGGLWPSGRHLCACGCPPGLWADPVPLAMHYVIAVAMAAAVSWMTCS
ncbi:hypothetical protein CHLRE_06g300144v5 [Chlamydomonas reinhardtii]|uniref:Uncharacterized protein n=1 Tax=Chlamydomonas reinhardtii TaxID=3055 RepID=A0A2K3DQW0_CHLRE|nr:uncharacterized protein CHLRE_06g300144v5 [Chlamydomonas reinhardtii]PNW82933.1 hypothetical protein CHLRE_06g300144v5 [Chlamydomonas reinhardtii]